MTGQVLWPAAAPLPRAQIKVGEAWKILVLVLVLPFFIETFQYVVDTPVPYTLAKVWPFLTLPLAVFAFVRVDLPYKSLLLVAACWLIFVSPLVNALSLGADLGGALSATIKVWPLTYGLSAAAVLALLKPEPKTLLLAFAILGAITFALLLMLWLVVPQSVYYKATLETTKVFLYDADRGARLNLPMEFGIFGLFLINRSFWRRPQVWQPIAIIIGLVLMIMIFKTRVAIATAIVTMILAATLSFPRWRGAIIAAGLAGLLIVIVPIGLWLSTRHVADALGGSLSIRQIEAGKAFDFLCAEPLRWLAGSGGAARVGAVSLGDVVGTPFFFPSDLGWLGVVFEYGAIGAGLMLALHLFALPLGWRAAKAQPVLGGAVFDYAVCMLLATPLTSVVLAPGGLGLMLALACYLISRPATRPCGGTPS